MLFESGTKTYAVTVSAGQVLSGIKVWVDGSENFPLTEWSFDRGRMELTLDSGASDGDAIHFLVALEPATATTTVPDVFLFRHGEAIKHGVIAELAMQPGNPWANFDLGQYHETLFTREVNRARLALNKAHTTKNIRVQPRLFV